VRRVWVWLGLFVVAAACGGGGLSLSEYVEQVDGIFERGGARYEVLAASPEGVVLIAGQGAHLGLSDQGAQLTDFTPQELARALEQVAAIQAEALATAAEIQPPEQIADLHELYFRVLPIAELAARAATATDWDDLSESPEMAAYRKALAADNQVCAELQAKLDATADREVFADNPWLPQELSEIVDYALGCASLPANPEDAYRPPSSTP
jgi:hypothetical protein